MNRSSGVLLPGAGFLGGELIAPPGTRMPFNQSTAPLGWTIDASSTLTDCTGVVRQASGGTTGGTTAWSGWNFGNTISVNSFTLSTAQLPSHSHTVNDPGHVATTGNFTAFAANATSGTTGWLISTTGGNNAGGAPLTTTDAATLNATINNAGSGSSVQPNYTTPQVKYTDHIIGVRS